MTGKIRHTAAVALASLAGAILAGLVSAAAHAQSSDTSGKIVPANLQGYCKKYFPAASVRFNYARQQWVCAAGQNGHKSIQMDVACQLANEKASYIGIRNGVPICRVPTN